MPTNGSCVAAAAPGKLRWLSGLAMATAALLGACATAPNMNMAERLPAERPSMEAQSLDAALASLTAALVTRAQLDPNEQRILVVDPPVDLATARNTAVTRAVERQVVDIMSQRFPHMRASPMTEAALERQPVVLLSCMTAVSGPGAMPPYTGGSPRTYRIWASLSDTRTNKIVSQETAWVRAEDVNATPTPFFQDSPAWVMDGSMRSYLKVCGGKPGDTMDAGYLNGMVASAATNSGIRAYEAGRYQEALDSYTRASQLPGGDQMRVRNGVYLSNLALGRSEAAEEAFGQIVDAGLAQGKLAVKFVFRPNSARFWPDRAVSGQYPVWLRQIAQRSATREHCLRLTGHTSPTGTPAANDILSERRAQFVRGQLVQRAPTLQARTEAQGRGARELVIGNGGDNATDLLDRRVELEPRPCNTLQAYQAANRAQRRG